VSRNAVTEPTALEVVVDDHPCRRVLICKHVLAASARIPHGAEVDPRDIVAPVVWCTVNGSVSWTLRYRLRVGTSGRAKVQWTSASPSIADHLLLPLGFHFVPEVRHEDQMQVFQLLQTLHEPVEPRAETIAARIPEAARKDNGGH
jgi:hypothetical protein